MSIEDEAVKHRVGDGRVTDVVVLVSMEMWLATTVAREQCRSSKTS